MQQVKDFFSNYMLMSAIAGWLGAQIIKVFTGMFKERSFNIATLLFSTGGMPSSHSAVVCALSTASVILLGWDAPVTAVCLALAVIVMIDAS
jgi:acid phosphatase family membrane protein YuiD